MSKDPRLFLTCVSQMKIEVSTRISDVLDRLAHLMTMQAGPLKYYSGLLHNSSNFVAIGAANVLLDQKVIQRSDIKKIIDLSKYQSIYLRAYEFFVETYDYESAQCVISQEIYGDPNAIQKYVIAKYSNDSSMIAELEIERFYRTGEIECLDSAARAYEECGGWLRSLPLLVDMILINPQNALWPAKLIKLLEDNNRFEEISQIIAIFDNIRIFPNISLLAKTAISYSKNEYETALNYLNQIDKTKLPSVAELLMMVRKAEIFEKMGQPKRAYEEYVRLNAWNSPEKFDPKAYEKKALALAEFRFSPIPDRRSNHFIMLGFPRSGTTLLENILSSHPEIETFEEVPSFSSVANLHDQYLGKTNSSADDFAERAQARYYAELDRRKRKTDAIAFIDKMPILSIQAAFLSKFFPDKKYIFSIRHPYDVVLSCFKQPFKPNIAMNGLTKFDDACSLYNFAMTQWFSNFSMEDERVCYVKYDDLVLDLKKTISNVFDFLDVQWHEDVHNFADKSNERRAKTPSYAKVRQGLTIGVQSSWQNYRFLFEKPEARVLDKWVQHFGYEGL